MVVVPKEEASVPGPSPILDRYERPDSHSLRTEYQYSWHRHVFYESIGHDWDFL
jgi:hypothetical protein